MYRNNVSLIGFAGKDAEARTTKNQKPYTVLSLATQSSYKDKKSGEYINHTEWHRVIAWGKLSEFARKIQKGTHLSIDGALVSRENTDTFERSRKGLGAPYIGIDQAAVEMKRPGKALKHFGGAGFKASSPQLHACAAGLPLLVAAFCASSAART